jgi:predicted transcriptional regulator
MAMDRQRGNSLKRYRSRLEILSSILRVALQGRVTKTRMRYGAYLSSDQLKEPMALLVSKGLIVQDEKANVYLLTAKGLRFLDLWDQIQEMLKAPEAMVVA